MMKCKASCQLRRGNDVPDRLQTLGLVWFVEVVDLLYCFHNGRTRLKAMRKSMSAELSDVLLFGRMQTARLPQVESDAPIILHHALLSLCQPRRS